MEKFKELQKLVNEKEKIDKWIEKVKTLGFIGGYSNKMFVGITEHENERFAMKYIGEIIGQEKYQSIIKQFEGLITVELFNALQAKEKEINSYEITIKSDLA